MTTFSRLVNSPVHAFQFKEIELDEAYKDSDLSVRIHHQLDAQFAAWREANLMVNTGVFEFAPVTDPEDLKLIINCNSFGQSRFKTHELKLGEWLVIEPMMLPLNGIVMTDEEFQDEYGRYVPRTVDTPRPE
jgi:hypothetical protein